MRRIQEATGACRDEIKGVAIVWYTVVGAVVLGFFVAYAAMFGFDKLKEAIAQLDQGKEE